jgi:hypothetical protein
MRRVAIPQRSGFLAHREVLSLFTRTARQLWSAKALGPHRAILTGEPLREGDVTNYIGRRDFISAPAAVRHQWATWQHGERSNPLSAVLRLTVVTAAVAAHCAPLPGRS